MQDIDPLLQPDIISSPEAVPEALLASSSAILLPPAILACHQPPVQLQINSFT